jgi:hypothetical protein
MENINSMDIEREEELKLISEWLRHNEVTSCPSINSFVREKVIPKKPDKMPKNLTMVHIPLSLKHLYIETENKVAHPVRTALNDLYVQTKYKLTLDDFIDPNWRSYTMYRSMMDLYVHNLENLDILSEKLGIERDSKMLGQLVMYYLKNYKTWIYLKVMEENNNGNNIRTAL